MQIPRLHSVARQIRKQLSAICLAAASAVLPVAAQAGPFSDMYVFGDSLSDTGNLQAMTTHLFALQLFPFPYPTNPETPYYQGRFSDGPLWVEDLAGQMGLPSSSVAPSGFSLGAAFGGFFVTAAGGNNFAVAGARTATLGFFEPLGLPIPAGVQTQVEVFLGLNGGNAPDGGTLYVVLAGGNNIRDAAYLLPNKFLRDAAVANAAASYAQAIGRLADARARTILVGNVLDMGKTPEAIQIGKSGEATAASRVFNATLTPLLTRLEAEKDIRVIRLDVYNLFQAVYNDATLHDGRDFGLTNATVPCFAGFSGSPGADCSVSIFADDIHPTAAAHRILARAAAACRDGNGAFLVQSTASDRTRLDFSRYCLTRQSP